MSKLKEVTLQSGIQ